MRISDWSSDVCSSDLSHDVTLIHRRDSFRAEKILQERLFAHPNIKVLWNKAVERFVGGGDPEGLVGVDLIDTVTGEKSHVTADGAFVAIGHKPATELFEGVLPLDEGYVVRSEEHTSELQSLMRISYAVFCLNKKKNTTHH